jgi:hypothetical protein
LTFVLSALIWSNIVGVVFCIMAFRVFRLTGAINLAVHLTPRCRIFNRRMCRSTLLAADAIAALLEIPLAADGLLPVLNMRTSENIWGTGDATTPARHRVAGQAIYTDKARLWPGTP